VEIGLPVAFAGGALAILSPCSALLLPSFFALAFASPRKILAQALLFYAGVAAVVVPLGLGAGAASALLVDHRDLTIVFAGTLLVGFGLYELAGGGVVLAPGLASRLGRVEGRFAALATGATYGFAGFCSGPILGAVLTVAATSGAAASGALLLGAFALGMTLPVAILALVWDRWHVADRRALRRTIWIGRSEVPIVRAVAGVLFVTLGVSFVVFRGSSALSGAYAAAGLADLLQRLETLLR